MSTTERITQCNVLFDADPAGPNLSLIIHFPVRFLLDSELQSLERLRVYGDYYISYIDLSQDISLIDDILITTQSLQEAAETLMGNIPFFDVALN